MFYKFLNKKISDKISEFHPIVVKYLSDDIERSDDESVMQRLKEDAISKCVNVLGG